MEPRIHQLVRDIQSFITKEDFSDNCNFWFRDFQGILREIRTDSVRFDWTRLGAPISEIGPLTYIMA